MRRHLAELWFLLAAGLVVAFLTAEAQPLPTASALPHLTRLSEREFVDLSKVSFIRLPVYVTAPPGCNDCQTRWGADIIVDSTVITYSVEAEAELRKLLGR